MKKLIVIPFLLLAFGSAAQFSPTYDTVRLKRGGKLYEMITYGEDSVKINGQMYRLSTGGFTSHWQTYGASYIEPAPDTKFIRYPAMPTYSGSSRPNTYQPTWFDTQSKSFKLYNNVTPDVLTNNDTISGCVGTYIYESNGADIAVVVAEVDSVCDCFTVRNAGSGSEVTITSTEGLSFDVSPGTSSTTITLKTGEWYTFCPDTTSTGKFVGYGYVLTNDSTYSKAEADTVFVKATEDSVYRYSAYSSGNNNVEVMATTKDVTASLANSNEITFTIPDGTRVYSAKIRVENLSSVVIFMGTADMPNTSMADRWAPVIQAWREDTGQQLTGLSSRLDLSDFTKTTINGLINTTKCQIRIAF